MSEVADMVEFSLRNTQKLNKICEPLKANFDVKAFWYSKTFADGSFFSIGTHAASHQHLYQENGYEHSPFCRKPDYLNEGVYLYRNYQDENFQKAVSACANKFQVEFCATTITKNQGELVRFGYGTEPGRTNVFQQNFLNNLPLLKKFNQYFVEETRSLLKNIDNNLINLPVALGSKYYKLPESFGYSMGGKEKNSFLKSIGCPLEQDLVKLTTRERELLKLTLNGYTANYIANELDLSRKTVENYLATLKEKLDCSTKSELINVAKHYAEYGTL